MALSITTSAVSVLKVMMTWSSLGTLLIVSFLLSLISLLVYKYVSDQARIKELREHLKRHQEELKSLKDDPAKMLEKQKEMMQKNGELMKHSLKPSLYTLVPFAIIYFWLRTAYQPLGHIIWILNWFWVYFISSLIFSMVLRKVLKVY